MVVCRAKPLVEEYPQQTSAEKGALRLTPQQEDQVHEGSDFPADAGPDPNSAVLRNLNEPVDAAKDSQALKIQLAQVDCVPKPDLQGAPTQFASAEQGSRSQVSPPDTSSNMAQPSFLPAVNQAQSLKQLAAGRSNVTANVYGADCKKVGL